MNQIKARFVKIAVNIESYSALLEIQKLISQSNKPVIFAGMGNCGKISRLIHKFLGVEGTFVGLNENPTASGQLTEADVKMCHLQSINSNYKIGGIIGGEQIENSLGLVFYNDYFHKQGLDAFYFPFIVDDLDDFNNWLLNCKFQNRFFGFSVTMPFKQMISKDDKICNLYLPRKNQFLNTDRDAIKSALKYLKIFETDRILVFGSGGSAKIILETLQNYSNVFVCSRSFQEIENYLSVTEAKKQSFDLLINCTPIGMDGEDFITETGIHNFKKLIDLPYQKEDTELICFCRKNSIPFVDGRQFWHWQAERQLIEFEKEIISNN
jgi:shikimate 5-dehydrogenase